MLFEKEYSFRGSHAERVQALTYQFDDYSSAKIFFSNINLYVIAPLIGFLYGRKANLDKSSNVTTKIFTQQLSSVLTDLQYNYRLIMLLDEKNEPTFEKRLDKAFRNYGNESEETLADEQLYEQYVLGGIDVLYEKLIESAVNPEDYFMNLYEFIEEFEERYNLNFSSDNILDLCRLAGD